MDVTILEPDPILVLCAVVLDGLFGDPVYVLHPIRLMGATLSFFERILRGLRLDGYAGGCFLFLLLSAFWVGIVCALACVLHYIQSEVGWIFQVFVLYSMIALKDLCKHGLVIDRAADLDSARKAASMLVGRDTDVMDAAACRRAGMESLSENAVDGFVSRIFWYALLGLPGIVLFKVVSTMDSMVGFKTPQYRYFGWCGARLDDGAQFCSRAFDVFGDGAGGVFYDRMFRAQGIACRVAATRACSRTKFRVERGYGCRCFAEAIGRSCLAGWDAGYRCVVRRCG